MSSPLGLLQACRAFRAGTLGHKEYVQTCARRADDLEPWLKSFIYRVPADKLAISESGPLAGIPVGIKDIIATADMPTTNGSMIYTDHVPDTDAAVVTRIRSLGGTILGKTVTTEFAWRQPGPTVNPWNRAHTPGGSSSGSAAAVAAGIVPLALGTQTMGSVVRPAAYCGVVGFKPSFGTVPRQGVHPLAGSLDHVGFFTRSVEDAAYALSLLSNTHGDDCDAMLPAIRVDVDSGIEALATPRLAIVRPPFWSRVSDEQNKAFEKTVDELRSAGARLEDVELPEDYWQGIKAADSILAAEAAVMYGPMIERFPDLTSTHLKELVVAGSNVTATNYIAACRLQLQLRHEIATHLSGFDAIITIPATDEAPEGLADTGDAIFCTLWTFLGVPALTLPVARSRRGLPLGVQLIGGYRQDARTLRAAKWIEQNIANPFSS